MHAGSIRRWAGQPWISRPAGDAPKSKSAWARQRRGSTFVEARSAGESSYLGNIVPSIPVFGDVVLEFRHASQGQCVRGLHTVRIDLDGLGECGLPLNQGVGIIIGVRAIAVELFVAETLFAGKVARVHFIHEIGVTVQVDLILVGHLVSGVDEEDGLPCKVRQNIADILDIFGQFGWIGHDDPLRTFGHLERSAVFGIAQGGQEVGTARLVVPAGIDTDGSGTNLDPRSMSVSRFNICRSQLTVF